MLLDEKDHNQIHNLQQNAVYLIQRHEEHNIHDADQVTVGEEDV